MHLLQKDHSLGCTGRQRRSISFKKLCEALIDGGEVAQTQWEEIALWMIAAQERIRERICNRKLSEKDLSPPFAR
jgi:hypothetical protein